MALHSDKSTPCTLPGIEYSTGGGWGVGGGVFTAPVQGCTWSKKTTPVQLFGSEIAVLRLFGGKVHGFHDDAGTRRGAGAEIEGEGREERAPRLRLVADHGRVLSAARHPKVRLF